MNVMRYCGREARTTCIKATRIVGGINNLVILKE